MFRSSSEEDYPKIVELYNEITGRGRTLDQHRWEWLQAPHLSHSFVIFSNKHDFLGHHGYLGIELVVKGKQLLAAKTENTILRKGFGSIYFPNESKIFNAIKGDYQLIFTTTASDNIARIREKLGYAKVGAYKLKFRVIDYTAIADKESLKSIRKIMVPLLRILNFVSSLRPVGYDKSLEFKLTPLSIEDITDYSIFSEDIVDRHEVIQHRSIDYLNYRLLQNPYHKYYRLFAYSQGQLCGGLIYYFSGNSVFIEDVLFKDNDIFEQLLKYLSSQIRKDKSAKVIKALTLQGSVLDKVRFPGFMDKLLLENGHFMANSLDMSKKFHVKDFYFTPLFMEGI